MNNDLQVEQEESDEFPALLIGTGLALASLILVPALAQRVGGLLVGGASLEAKGFAAMARAAG